MDATLAFPLLVGLIGIAAGRACLKRRRFRRLREPILIVEQQATRLVEISQQFLADGLEAIVVLGIHIEPVHDIQAALLHELQAHGVVGHRLEDQAIERGPAVIIER